MTYAVPMKEVHIKIPKDELYEAASRSICLAHDSCPKCWIKHDKFVALEHEIDVIDFHDPLSDNGHGQSEMEIAFCPRCEAQFDKESNELL